VQPVWYSPS